VAVAPAAYPGARTQRSGRTPLFVLGVGMALFAFLAVFLAGIVLQGRSSTGRRVPAVVAARDILPRQLITADLVTVSMVPETALPPHALVRLADVKGETALVTIYRGQVLSGSVVTGSPDQIDEGSVPYLPIPAGFVAMTIPTNELQGVAGYVAPGDYINIIATLNTALFGAQPPKTVTRTVFTSVRVIRIGPPSAGPKTGQEQGVATSLTVLLTQCDAQFMEWLILNASLKYALLSYKDYAPAPTAADPNCPATVAPAVIGAGAADSRWGFTKG
jgi:pilus assembly protein CpaB